MKASNVFIATIPRSGSTLVGMMLGAHSQVCHIGESAYWSKLDIHATKCCCGVTGCQTLVDISGILSSFPNEIGAINTACGVIDACEEPEKIRHPLSLSANLGTSESLETVIQACRAGLNILADAARTVSGKEYIVENSKYISIAEVLLSTTNNWKIIVVTRDPRGVALSSREVGERKGVTRQVKDKLDVSLAFARRAASLIQQERVLLMRYEDLCSHTLETLDTACKFIGVSFEERMLRFKEYKGHLLMGNHMMYDANQEVMEDVRWREELSAREQALFLTDDFIQAYARLGYDLAKPSKE